MTQEKSLYPLVCVILLNWNGWQDTLACLASLERLEYPNHRLLVVDNCSTDDSVTRIRAAYPDLSLIQIDKNLGFAGGNNVGIRHALAQGAEYIWLLNNDTVVESRALGAMVKAAEEDARIGAVGSVLYEMQRPGEVQAWGGGKVSTWWGISRYHKGRVSKKYLHYITGASIMIKSSALREVGLLDERFFMYWEDVDFGVRLRKAGWKLVVAADSHVQHREFASSGGTSVLTDVYFNSSAVPFFEKHARVPIMPIVVGAGGRTLKRLLRKDLDRAAVVVRSTFGKLNSLYGRQRG